MGKNNFFLFNPELNPLTIKIKRSILIGYKTFTNYSIFFNISIPNLVLQSFCRRCNQTPFFWYKTVVVFLLKTTGNFQSPNWSQTPLYKIFYVLDRIKDEVLDHCVCDLSDTTHTRSTDDCLLRKLQHSVSLSFVVRHKLFGIWEVITLMGTVSILNHPFFFFNKVRWPCCILGR